MWHVSLFYFHPYISKEWLTFFFLNSVFTALQGVNLTRQHKLHSLFPTGQICGRPLKVVRIWIHKRQPRLKRCCYDVLDYNESKTDWANGNIWWPVSQWNSGASVRADPAELRSSSHASALFSKLSRKIQCVMALPWNDDSAENEFSPKKQRRMASGSTMPLSEKLSLTWWRKNMYERKFPANFPTLKSLRVAPTYLWCMKIWHETHKHTACEQKKKRFLPR